MSRTSLRRLLRVVVAAGLLVILFRYVPLDRTLAALRAARPVPVAATLVLAFLSQVTIAARLRVMARAEGLAATTVTLLQINLATLFYGLFLPGGNVAGIAVRFARMAEPGGNLSGTAVVVLLDRIVATWALCLVGLSLWTVAEAASFWPIAVLMASIVAGVPVLFRLAGRVGPPSPPPATASGRRRRLAALVDAVRRAGHWPVGVATRVVALSVLAQGLGIGAYVAAARSVGLDPGTVVVGWARSAAVLATLVPVSLSGLGIREGALVVLLTPYGLPSESIVAFGLVVFSGTVVAMAAIGALSESVRLLRRAPEQP